MRIPSSLLAALSCLFLTTAGCSPGEEGSEQPSSTNELGSGSTLTDHPPAPRACTGQFDDTGRLCLLHSGLRERQRLVIGDLATWTSTWQRMWSTHSPRPELPTVDFEHEAVLLVAMGERSTGGHVIELRDVSALSVSVAEMSPDKASCPTDAALSQPLAALRVPRPQGEVRFTEVRETYRCH